MEPLTIQQRRKHARNHVYTARISLRQVIELFDSPGHDKAREHASTALAACMDLADEIDSMDEADLAVWANAHGESGAALAAEAKGEA